MTSIVLKAAMSNVLLVGKALRSQPTTGNNSDETNSKCPRDSWRSEMENK